MKYYYSNNLLIDVIKIYSQEDIYTGRADLDNQDKIFGINNYNII